MVGTGGLEPPTSCVSSRRSNQTELRAYRASLGLYSNLSKIQSMGGGIALPRRAASVAVHTDTMWWASR